MRWGEGEEGRGEGTWVTWRAELREGGRVHWECGPPYRETS
jgi:hypothetical protein